MAIRLGGTVLRFWLGKLRGLSCCFLRWWSARSPRALWTRTPSSAPWAMPLESFLYGLPPVGCFVHWILVGSSQWRAMEDQILGEEKGWVLHPLPPSLMGHSLSMAVLLCQWHQLLSINILNKGQGQYKLWGVCRRDKHLCPYAPMVVLFTLLLQLGGSICCTIMSYCIVPAPKCMRGNTYYFIINNSLLFLLL